MLGVTSTFLLGLSVGDVRRPTSAPCLRPMAVFAFATRNLAAAACLRSSRLSFLSAPTLAFMAVPAASAPMTRQRESAISAFLLVRPESVRALCSSFCVMTSCFSPLGRATLPPRRRILCSSSIERVPEESRSQLSNSVFASDTSTSRPSRAMPP